MQELLDTDDFSSSFHRYASSLIYTLSHGKRLEAANLPEAQEVEQIIQGFLYAARVGTWIVDAFPALDWLLGWMASWKVRGEELHQYEARIMSKNLEKGKAAKGWNWTKNSCR